MKTLMRIAAAAALLGALSMSGLAGEKPDVPYNRDLAETNLLIGLGSDNEGLRLSAASILAEVGTERSVIPLMDMLHNGSEGERIVAALALARIGDGRGAYAVKRAAQFDPSEKVQRTAAWYYMEYAVPKPDRNVAEQAIALVFAEAPMPYGEFTELNESYYAASHAGE